MLPYEDSICGSYICLKVSNLKKCYVKLTYDESSRIIIASSSDKYRVHYQLQPVEIYLCWNMENVDHQ